MYKNLIAVTNRHLVSGDFIKQIEKIATLGPESLILREKDLSDGEYTALALGVKEICEKKGVRFFVCGRIDLARKIGCRNIHLSLPDFLSAGDLSDFANVSVSCHSLDDVKKAAGATRIILGTIFPTECKKGHPGMGLDFLRQVCENTSLPVYAIGGIKEENIKDVMNAGAKGGCMMSAFMKI